MKRVAVMLPKLSLYGGAEQFGYRLAEHLAREFSVTYICARQETEPPAGVRVLCVRRPFPGLFGKTLWFALAAEHARRRGQFDLSIGLGKTLCQDLLRLSGGPTSLFWEYSLRAWPSPWARRWKALRRELSPGNALGRFIEQAQLTRSKILVANSHFVRDITCQAFPALQHQDIPVFYNQPDLTRFQPASLNDRRAARQEFNLPQDQRLVLTAGTNFRLKGIFPLTQALQYLPENVHLLVAGGRGTQALHRAAQTWGVRHRLHLLGRVDTMPRLYQAADLFVLNSFYDACANAVLEALACGLPSISTANNGSSVFLCPQAIIPDPNDSSDIAQRICTLLGAKSTARPDFHPISGLDAYHNLIRELLYA